jgi:threonine aldolase
LMQGVYAARLVTHLDVSRDDVNRFVGAVGDYFVEAAK